MIPLPSKKTMAGIHITDIEAAINHWRAKNPSSPTAHREAETAKAHRG